MEFRLLGTVEAHAEGRLLDVGPPKRRFVLALLLLEPNQTIPVARFVDLIWPDDPPPGARKVVFSHICRLRQSLAKAGAAGHGIRLTTTSPGYALHVDPMRVDVHRFRRMVGEARNVRGATERAGSLRAALELWRGPPLADVADPDVRSRLCGGLDEMWCEAVEDRIAADLECRRHRALVGELSALLAHDPLRERLVGQLMLAQYRSGMRAAALETFHAARARLADQLGLDPGAELRRLHEAILRDDPELELPPTPGQPVGSPQPRPAQLPPDVAGLVGRDELLRLLSAARHRVLLIVGGAGVGKTALAVHWAHRVQADFPDGQLFLDLRGHAPSAPLRPIEALTYLLTALGVPADEIPVDADIAAARYRSSVAGKRILLVLDNAVTAEQVRPLLPGCDGCVTVVTSRNRLTGLVAREGAHRVALQTLDQDAALALLGWMTGSERVAAEPVAAAELVRRCAYLPLAVRIAAANLADDTTRSIASWLAELGGEAGLAALSVVGDDQLAVRAAFDLSYNKLTEPARRVFRLFGLAPGSDISLDAVTVLAGADVADVRKPLAELVSACLIEQRVANRYSAHDLLRQYAKDIAGDEREARHRMLHWYVDAVEHAIRALSPHLLIVPIDLVASGSPVPEFDNGDAALAWLDSERANLVEITVWAEAHGSPKVAWALAGLLGPYVSLRMPAPDRITMVSAGLRAAIADDSSLGQAAAHISLALIHHRCLSNLADAIEHNQRGLELCRSAGWREGEANATGNLGNVYREIGRLADAEARYTRVLALEREIGRRTGEGTALNNLGALCLERGDVDRAIGYYDQALALRQAMGDRLRVGRVLLNLADANLLRGRFVEGLEQGLRALAAARETGDRANEPAALGTVAALRGRLGHYPEALADCRSALALAREGGSRRVQAAVLVVLGQLHAGLGEHRQAIAPLQEALALARDSSSRHVEADALIALAGAHRQFGEDDAARSVALAADELTWRFGYRLLEHSGRMRSSDQTATP
jgi:DNA-binding SARP family transcriptional activator